MGSPLLTAVHEIHCTSQGCAKPKQVRHLARKLWAPLSFQTATYGKMVCTSGHFRRTARAWGRRAWRMKGARYPFLKRRACINGNYRTRSAPSSSRHQPGPGQRVVQSWCGNVAKIRIASRKTRNARCKLANASCSDDASPFQKIRTAF